MTDLEEIPGDIADEPTAETAEPADDEPTPDQERVQAHSWLIGAFDAVEALAKNEGSRELSLVLTKLEEAEMWLLRHVEKQTHNPEVIQ